MADAIAPPTNRRELAALMRRLHAVQAQLARRAAHFDSEYAQLHAKHEAAAADLIAQHSELSRVIATYAQENRDQLVVPGTKTIKLPQGTISWRYGKQKAVVDADAAEILKFLRRKGWLRRFTKPQEPKLVKELLVQDPARANQIPGVHIVRGEILTIDTDGPEISAHARGNPYKVKSDDS